MSNFVITIDGPAGSGKSTVARKVANKLGLIHLNSGVLYRALALKAMESGISLADDSLLTGLVSELDFKVKLEDQVRTVLLVDDEDVDSEVVGDIGGRIKNAGEGASQVAVHKGVREALTQVQRNLAKGHSVILEGRDAGTVVFPDAQFKFYLDANLETRIKRRHKELIGQELVGQAKGMPSEAQASEAQVREELTKRDHRDATRKIAPQVPAKDAIIIDTSSLSVDEVVEKICVFININF